MELAAVLTGRGYEVAFALPSAGPLASALAGWGELYYYRASSSLLKWRRNQASLLASANWLRARNLLEAVADLTRVVAAAAPDIVHTNSQKAHILGALAARRVPVIWHMRDILPASPLRSAVDAVAAMRATRIIAVSRAVADQFKWARKKVTVIYNGILPPRQSEAGARDNIRKRWGIPAGAKVIGCVGQIAPWKGQHVFVRAAIEIVRKISNVRFVVVGAPLYGDGAYYGAVRAEVKRSGLEDFFRFTGYADDGPACIGALDVLAHTAVEPEPFGRVIVEAMARGVPVVASATGGPVEIIRHGVDGILVPPGDTRAYARAILNFVTSKNLTDRVVASARATFIERFTIDRVAAEVTAVYEQVKRVRDGVKNLCEAQNG